MKKRLLYSSILILSVLYTSCQCSKNKDLTANSNKKVEEAPKHNAPDQHTVDSLKNSYKKHSK